MSAPKKRFSLRQWPEIERWVVAAEELPTHERSAFLDSECPEHLRDTVNSLLSGLADTSTGTGALLNETLIQDALGHAASEATHSPSVDRSHLRIGPYKVLEMLGHGGMGVVYLCERESTPTHQPTPVLQATPVFQATPAPPAPVSQLVALKVLRADLTGEEAILRFRRERVLLAAVKSPHVPQMLNAGTTQDGRPWFAMEFVDGEPIMDYVERTQPDRDERLELFHAVCTAVAHIHDHLVVHRDVKPSNIFVNKHEGKPHVHMLDFGIATVARTRGEADYQSVLTLTDDGTAPYSPAFAAPEQLENTPADPALDIWALGVLLCLLLTGGRPRRFPFCGENEKDCHMGGLCRLAAHKNPQARFPTARAFSDAVTKYPTGRTTNSPEPPDLHSGDTPERAQ